MNPVITPNPHWWVTALRVYMVIHFMAFAAWPWFTRLFSSRKDRGAGLAMAGGIVVFLTTCQFFWRSGLLEIRFVWLVLIMFGLSLSGRKLFFKPANPSSGTRARMRSAFLQGWLLFSFLFWYWASIRSADPGVTHTEQAMDVMWMQAATVANQPPVRDAWFQGEATTYYVDGHQGLAFLGVKLGLPIQQSVNLTQIIWFALSGLLAFHAAKSFYELKNKKGGNLAGGIAVLLVCFVSTPQGFQDAISPSKWWWWWDASRVISDGDSPLITEFPYFSFWLGDNHAHVIALPYLLLTLVSGLALFRCRKITLWQTLLPVLLVAWSWRMNAWQTPTAFAFPVLCLLFRKRKLRLSEGIALAGATCIALILLYPLRAPGPSLSLLPYKGPHTSPLALLNVFGFLLPGVCWLFIKKPHRIWSLSLLLTLSMLICVELVYLDDAFHNRMNTLFKVFYQVWILLGVLAAVGWACLLQYKGILKAVAMVCLLGCLLPGLAYAGKLTWQAHQVKQRSLDAWDVYPKATQHLLKVAHQLIKPGDRIAEAPGKSYDAQTSILGTWTAGDNLVGWEGHQYQWRSNFKPPPLNILYEAQNAPALDHAIQTLKVDWIFISANEQTAYNIQPDWENWLSARAHCVVNQPEQRLYRVK